MAFVRLRTLASASAFSLAVLGALPASSQMALAQQSNAPILIGVLAPFTHIDGQSIVNGAKLAADDINKSGGIEGRPVKLMLYDTHLSAAEAVRTPANELLIGLIAWIVIALLWLFVTRARAGKALLAASMSPVGLALVGFELDRAFAVVWGVYGVLAGVAGVLLASFLGTSPDQGGDLTASAFSIVVLGGLGSVSGSLAAAYIIGYLETVTAYLASPALRELPGLLIIVLVLIVRPHGILGRQ